MRSYHIALILSFTGTILFLALGQPAQAQVALVDDILLITQGQKKQEQLRTDEHLGPSAGSFGNRLGPAPGAGDSRLGEFDPNAVGAAGASMARRDVAAAVTALPRPTGPGSQLRMANVSMAPLGQLPNFGPLEIPALDEAGPADGLTLDGAINQLTQANYDLRSKFQEIPKAQADILSAGLRNNPLLFFSADTLPYGRYSPTRPGEDNYGFTVIQPFDIGHKRQARIASASQAKSVIHAQYQNAVRLEIDNLYTAFVDVLAAREAVRYAESGLAGMEAVAKTTQSLVKGNEEAMTTLTRVEGQLEAARIALSQARSALVEANEVLANHLAFPDGAAMALQLNASIRETAVQVPAVDNLVGLAISLRPDLNAYRLGIRRAQNDVTLARREAVPDFFLLYTPYTSTNNTPVGGRDAQSWSLGAFSSVPLFNRNQGNIARASQNVRQTAIEAEGVERRIASEVRRAYLDYTSNQESLDRLERIVLPKLKEVRDKKYNMLVQGQEQALVFLDAQREYNEVVRQYRDTLVRRRRAVLKLNTVIGQRLFP